MWTMRIVVAKRRVMIEDECIEWDGSLSSTGYGRIGFRRTKKNIEKYDLECEPDYRKTTWVGAHRLAWAERRGKIPKGIHVLHHCDNPPCVNIDHLYLGTPKDNHNDMVRRGRYVNGMARLLAKRTHCKRGHLVSPERGMCNKCKNHTRRLWRVERKRKGLPLL